MEKAPIRWTNPSVRALLAPGRDPIDEIKDRARAIVIEAMEAGWQGPPFDPFKLAEYLKVAVVARDDVRDARTVPVGASRACIEFNPRRSRARIRYSVAHEIAHTMFPDCLAQIRHRARHEEMKADDWQLELLCNVAAAEFLMPIGTLEGIADADLAIDRLVQLRETYEVSAEALLIRVAHAITAPLFMFASSRLEAGTYAGRYRVDYTVGPERLVKAITRGALLPADSVVAECTAIGYTAKRDETWEQQLGRLRLECVGVSPYPGSSYPRVLGIARPSRGEGAEPAITYLVGDALRPRGRAPRLLVHVVNDKTANWGGAGFAQTVRRRWPSVQESFKSWAEARRENLKLGSTHVEMAEEGTYVASMVAQHGYAPSAKPKLRYAALEQSLRQVAEVASSLGAGVHMPRIGTGYGGGAWFIIREMINTTLSQKGVTVAVYDLPNNPKRAVQGANTLPLFE